MPSILSRIAPAGVKASVMGSTTAASFIWCFLAALRIRPVNNKAEKPNRAPANNAVWMQLIKTPTIIDRCQSNFIYQRYHIKIDGRGLI